MHHVDADAAAANAAETEEVREEARAKRMDDLWAELNGGGAKAAPSRSKPSAATARVAAAPAASTGSSLDSLMGMAPAAAAPRKATAAEIAARIAGKKQASSEYVARGTGARSHGTDPMARTARQRARLQSSLTMPARA